MVASLKLSIITTTILKQSNPGLLSPYFQITLPTCITPIIEPS